MASANSKNVVREWESAFPVQTDECVTETQWGMHIRDYFAAKAMQGCLAYSMSDPMNGNWQNNASVDSLAEHAYAIADAMMRARAK